jgi:hypothetical protein
VAITLASNFDINAALPIDSRFTVADNTARDALAAGVRYEGLTVHVVATSLNWQLQGGITNGDWVDISVSGGGGSGGGAENLITDGDAEAAGASIFTAYADAAGTRPVDGTGGSPNVTTSLSTTNPINGLKDFRLIKDAANRQGQGWATTVTIPLAYRGKSLKTSIKYLVTSGTFAAGNNGGTPADGDVIWYYYDITNSKLVEPSNIKMFTSATDFTDVYESTVQFDYNTASVRLIAHVASTSASAYTLQVDDVTLTPQTYVFGTPVTDWVAWTPVGSWNTNVTYTGLYRRVGSEYEYQVRIDCSGAPNAASLTVNLPSGHVIDNAKLLDTVNGYGQLQGSSAHAGDAGSNGFDLTVKYLSTTAISIYRNIGLSSGDTIATGNPVNATNPFTFGNTDFVSMFFKLPITGLNQVVQMSESCDTRQEYFSATKSGNQSISNTTSTKVTFDTFTNNSHGAWDGTNNRYVVKTAGPFNIAGTIGWAANATGFRQVGYSINGGTVEVANMVPSVGAGDATINAFAATTAYLNAGDYIELYGYQSSGASLNAAFNLARLRITKIAGPQAIAAIEKINMRYTTTAGQSLATGDTTLAWPTKDYDTHLMLSSNTTVTIKAAGFYAIHAVLHVPAGVSGLSTQLFKLLKNGSIVTECNYAKTYVVGVADKYEVYDELNLVAGDTITIVYSNGFGVGSIPASTIAGHNSFKVHRI